MGLQVITDEFVITQTDDGSYQVYIKGKVVGIFPDMGAAFRFACEQRRLKKNDESS